MYCFYIPAAMSRLPLNPVSLVFVVAVYSVTHVKESCVKRKETTLLNIKIPDNKQKMHNNTSERKIN